MVCEFDDVLGCVWFVFDMFELGMWIDYGGCVFLVFDVCIVCCMGGDGELLFCVDVGWEVCVVDLCMGNVFVIYDYFDVELNGGILVVYVGEVLEFDVFVFIGLCDIENDMCDKCGVELVLFVCLSCGVLLLYVLNVVDYVVCGSCYVGVWCMVE